MAPGAVIGINLEDPIEKPPCGGEFWYPRRDSNARPLVPET